LQLYSDFRTVWNKTVFSELILVFTGWRLDVYIFTYSFSLITIAHGHSFALSLTRRKPSLSLNNIKKSNSVTDYLFLSVISQEFL